MTLDKLLQLIGVNQVIRPRFGEPEFVLTLLLSMNLFPARLMMTAKRLGSTYITFHNYKMLPREQIDSIS